MDARVIPSMSIGNKKGDAMKENRVSNEFRQGREATFAALLMELCLCGERIASIMGIRNWYDQVGTVRIFLCILIFVIII